MMNNSKEIIMKKYMLTWYGITDLKASLGLTPSDGPVLSAIKQGDYTDVIILAYTNKEKIEKNSKSGYDKKNTNTWIRLKHSILSRFQNGKARFISNMKTIDKYSNTEMGHLHYKNWLKKNLKIFGKDVELTMLNNELDRLNDASGIYKAVSNSLNLISADSSEKEVTVFLSPGTPVMAFNWAFTALMNPGLHIKVIASSDSRKPPEEIDLPFELLNIGKIQRKKSERNITEFDIIFHLFGEQRMPSLLGIRQFECKLHIFVNSSKYPALMMKLLVGDTDFQELRINPFDPKNIEATILQEVANHPDAQKIGFNLTGGTKLMYAGALQAAKKLKAVPFYFETLNHNLIYLDSFEFAKVRKIDDVEVFIKANTPEFTISDQGFWQDNPLRKDQERAFLTNDIWGNRRKISKLYKQLSKYNDKPGKSFHIKRSNIEASLNTQNQAEIRISSKTYKFSNWPYFAQYLCGCWFEEYVYLKLYDLFNQGLIYDLRINMEISIKQNKTLNNKSNDWKDQLDQRFGERYQELDIVFTDGKSLYIIECKAGSVKSEGVMKLQNNIRFFGGIDGKAILVSVFEPNHNVIKKKIESAKNVELVYGYNILKKIKKLIK